MTSHLSNFYRVAAFVLGVLFLFALLGGSLSHGQTIEYKEGDEIHTLDSLAFYGEADWPEDAPLVRGMITYSLGSGQASSHYTKLGFPPLKTCVERTGADMTLQVPHGVVEKFEPQDTLVITDKTWTLCTGYTTLEDTSRGAAMTLWGQNDMARFQEPVYAGLLPNEKFQLHLVRDGQNRNVGMTVNGRDDWGYQSGSIQEITNVFLEDTTEAQDPRFTVGFETVGSTAYDEWTVPVSLTPEPGRDSLYIVSDTMHVITELVGEYSQVEPYGGRTWHGRRGDTTVVVNFDVREGGVLFDVSGSVKGEPEDSLEVTDTYVVASDGRQYRTETGNATHLVERRVRGDVTGDGDVTWADMRSILAAHFLGAEVNNPKELDVNGDGGFDFRDAVELFNRLK